jgi:hypothetical protein
MSVLALESRSCRSYLILCYNDSLVPWTVVSLTANKLKLLMFSISGFVLSLTLTALLTISPYGPHRRHRSIISVQFLLWKYAYMWSRYLVTDVALLPLSRSLPSNRSTCHNIYNTLLLDSTLNQLNPFPPFVIFLSFLRYIEESVDMRGPLTFSTCHVLRWLVLIPMHNPQSRKSLHVDVRDSLFNIFILPFKYNL